jgi:NitT/TauT family transport system substrate-binding protein
VLVPPAIAGDLAPVRIAVTRDASIAAVLIAIDAGYFKVEGLDPKLSILKTDASVSAAVASDQADIGLVSLSAPYFNYAATHRLKIIASRSSDKTGFPLYALLVSQKARAAGLTGVRGLANAKIGIEDSDSGAYYALFKIASRFDLGEDAVKTIVLKSNAGELAALSRGTIDAALLPYSTALVLANKGRSILHLSNFAEWQQGVVFTAADTVQGHRSLIAAFMRAYQHGTADYALNFQNYDDGGDFIPGSNYDRYLDMMARQIKVSPELLARTKTYTDRRGNLDTADIRTQVKFWQDRGKLDKNVSADDLLDQSFIGEEGAAPAANQ